MQGNNTKKTNNMPESKEEKIRRLNQELEDFIAAEVAKSQEKTGDEKSFEEILQVYRYMRAVVHVVNT